jgi:tetratricopeptide (TPR) repeat protein/DNA-binding XRE family transcriptional regulator
MTDEVSAFGSRLSACRQSAGLSQEELAARAGLSIRALSNLERGRTRWPHPDSVHRLADALGLCGKARQEFAAAADRRLISHWSGSLTAPHSRPLLVDSGRTVPRQLPGSVRHFVGRKRELMALLRPRDDTGTGSAAAQILALVGMAGVGKTALAVRWAHIVAGEFPDGQLYVNLRGYDSEQPMAAGDALAGFLRALGVPGPDVPSDTDECAAMYRSLLAGRRILVLLDNARRVEQVRPLLPGSPGCVTLVTSRDALAGLVARDGAVRLDLSLLPPAEATELLRALIGDRVDACPDAAEALAARCAWLPLALRLAAELAAARPAASLRELDTELADQGQRLDRLDADGDPRTAIRAVFSWSYRHLEPDAARAFRMLSLATGTDVDRFAAAAVIGGGSERASQLVDQLRRAHLLQATVPGRLSMHDLLRAYGKELTAACDAAAERRSALTRLFDYYLQTTAAAMHTLFPIDVSGQPPVSTAAASPPTDHPAAARAWLDAERENLVLATAHAAAHGWPCHAIRLASCLFRYFDVGGHLAQAVTLHSHARGAARQLSDRAAEAAALTSLGVVSLRQGRLRRAACHFRQAVRLCEEAGDRGGEARALVDLGLVELRRGRYQQGRRIIELGAVAYRDVGDRSGEARALANLGILERHLGRCSQASQCLLQALAICRATGDRLSQAPVLTNLGLVDLQRGQYEQAVGRHRAALALFREAGNRNGEAHSLSNLGIAELRWRRYRDAKEHLRDASALFRETSDTAGQAEALNGLGQLFLATGEPGQARAQHTAALELTSPKADKYEHARAHEGLGHCYQASEDPGRAVRHWQQALALYVELGAREAGNVRAQLAAAGNRLPAC